MSLTLERVFVTLSLLVNVLVLFFVCGALLQKKARAEVVYGGATPARGILLAVYLAIFTVSCLLIPLVWVDESAIWMAVGLLVVQIIYKVISFFTTNGGVPDNMKHNPVVLSNVAIAVFHLITVLIVAIGWS